MQQPPFPATSGAPFQGGTAHFAPFLGAIIDTIGIGLWDWNLVDNTVIYSRQWEAIAGYAEGELPQTVDSWNNTVLPADLPCAEAEIARHLRGEIPVYEAEFRLVRKDGQMIWAQDRGVVTEWDENGKPTRLIGVLQDVTRIKKTEQALQEKREQLDFVAKISGLGMWDWDIPRAMITYNDDYLEMIGYTKDEISGNLAEWESFNHPDDLPAVNRALQDYLSGKTDTYVIETRMRHKDGHYVWTLDTGRIVERDSEGTPIRLLGGHLNINKLKQAELSAKESLAENSRYNERLQADVRQAMARLAQSEEFSNTMFEASPYIASIFDDQMRLMDCNPMAVEYFGFSSKQELLQNMLPLLEKSIPKFQPSGAPSVPLAKRFQTAVQAGSLDFDTEMILNEKHVPMRIIFKKVAYKGSFAIAVYMMDLGTLREAKNELLHQDRLLRVVNTVSNNLMGASPEIFDNMVWKCMGKFARAVDADRMYIWRNTEKGGKLYCQQAYDWNAGPDIQPHTVHGQNEDYISDYSNIQALYDTLRQGKPTNSLTKNTPQMVRQGLASQGIKAILVLPVIIQNVFWGFIGFDNCKTERIFTDTEVKVLESGSIILVTAILRNELTKNLILAREEALASTRAKSDFLSRMSHEIRTPMNAIIGMNTIARKTRDYNRIQYCLGKIDSASGQLLDIINDILDMSKIESGKLEVSESEFDFEAMMQGVFDVIQLRVEQGSQTFTVEFESLFEHLIICDELRLSQVTTNLLSNAAKFTPPGGEIRLRIAHHQSTEGRPVLRVAVQDNGIGISKEQQQKLFQSFEQGDGGITRRYGGTGLGLAICKRILSMMGGDIWVESELGKGSTFTFELPFAWGRELKNVTAKKNMPKDLRVLVVDDSEDVRVYFSTLLASFSLLCESAASGRAAVQMVEAAQKEGRPYHLVFVDWMMPHMGGTDTARKIKALAKDKTTVVMISAAEWSEIEREVQDFGVTEYLSKPILPSVLFNTILRLTGNTLVAPPEETIGDIYNWNDKKILLVEDLAINREIIHGILEDTGVGIDNAENGRIGVDMFLKSPQMYDLVLMDMQMPELDGLGATREIRASGALHADTIPILAMTANAFKEDVENCMAAGMNGHIAKPVDVDVLMRVLEAYFDGKAVG